VWPETHSKSTAVERCSVRVVWSNTRKVQKSVPSVATVLLIKEVSTIWKRIVWYMHIIIIIIP
jgi:hypothetical protein